MLVVDASVLVSALADDGDDGDQARAALRGNALVAPQIIDLEVVSALRRRLSAGLLPARRADLALQDLGDLALKRAPHAPFVGRCWQLRANLTPYDAVYVALAEALGAALVTADKRLAQTPGVRCEIVLLG